MIRLDTDSFGSFPELIRHRAAAHPNRIALTFRRFGSEGDASLTFGQLADRIHRLAAGLAERFQPGERALLLFAPGLEFPVAFFGCLSAGIIPVPLYPPQRNQNLDRLQAVLADADAAFALSDAATAAELESRRGATGETVDVPVLHIDDLSGDASWEPPRWERSALAFLQYTSGSTGKPKGVAVSHGNLLVNSEDLDRGWEHSPESVMVSWLPVFHDMGLIYGLLQPIYKGFHGVLMAPFSFLKNPLRWLETLTLFRGTHSAAPNFAFDMCVDRSTPERCEDLDLSSWRMAMNGAEPIHPETLQRFAETFAPYGFSPSSMTPGYGLAETTLKVTSQRWHTPPTVTAFDAALLEGHTVRSVNEDDVADVSRRLLVGCGWTEIDTEIAIVDPETSQRAPENKAGEIWVSGQTVAQGYWNQPKESAQTFGATLVDEDGKEYLRTGDLGFIHDGELFIAGRLKDLVIIRGRNVYPHDIERAVGNCHEHLRTGSGVAFSVEIERAEELVVVQEVARKAQKTLEAEEIFADIRQALGDALDLQPYAIVLVRQSSIGKTSSGKLQRRACKQAFLDDELQTIARWQRPTPQVDSVAPETADVEAVDEMVAQLKPIFETALGLGPGELQADAPIARYGMSSRVAVQLAASLEESFGLELPATLLYDYPSLEAVSRFLLTGEGRTGADAARRESTSNAPVHSGPMAVVGIGCRFPGATGKAAFWNLLSQGVDAVGPMPPQRAALLPARSGAPDGGYIDGVELFDSAFFGISPREVERMDPQQRLLLEVAMEALEDAAMRPEDLAGTSAGVFVGISTHDYERLQLESGGGATSYTGTGNAASIAANRLSYHFDLRGPSVAVDTACSSSLVAIHLARRSLAAGDCDLALVGGVNLLLDTEITSGFRQAQMMAPGGRCRTFDAKADGYVRGEGCGLLVLQRLDDAQRDGNPILGVLHGSAINQDGRSNGLTAPNRFAQEAVIRHALQEAGATVDQIGYVEAHGTGTPLGDPIEVHSLRHVFESRTASNPCTLGSVKTNIGHLEAAAGIAGVIKVLLSLESGQIPPHLHFEALNPEVDLGTCLRIPTQLTPWPSDGEASWAGISSFGFGGSNAHLIVGPAPQGLPTPSEPQRDTAVLPLSATGEEALAGLAERYAEVLGTGAPWRAVAATAATGRTHHTHRLAVTAKDAEGARRALEEFVATGGLPNGATGRVSPQRPKLGFLFTGQGAQAPGMGRQLYEEESTFRAALDRCAETLEPILDVPLLELLYPPTEHGSELKDRIHQTQYTQVTLFAVEYGLTELLASWGLVPDAVLGHSIGEYAAACVAGVMDLESALRLVAVRGRVMQALPAGGGMTTFFASSEEVVPLAEEAGLAIAAINAPRKIVVSGPLASLETMEARAQDLGIEFRRLKVSHAFHSELMDPALTEFESAARVVDYQAPTVPLYSNLTGDAMTAAPDAVYWRDHLRNTVRFAEGLESLMASCDVLLEVGPRPVLSSLAAEIGTMPTVPTLKSGQNDTRRLADTLARLYCEGASIDWSGVYTEPRLSGLPTYPFQRTRHWYEPIARQTNTAARLIPYADLATAPELTAQLQDLVNRYGLGAGSVSQVTGKSLIFLSARGNAFCFLGQRGASVFALDYTGPEEAWRPFVGELLELVNGQGLELNWIEETARHLPELRQMGFGCTTIGTWQDIDNLSNFSLDGRKMRRLRYLANRYRNEGHVEVVEVAGPGLDPPGPELHQEMQSILETWAAGKGMDPGFVDAMGQAITSGLPLGRHRVFAVRRDQRIDGAILILPAAALGGYLMDMEFYRDDAAPGWAEHGIATILDILAKEGKERFSLGLTLGTQIEAMEGDEAAVRELFETLHDEDILNGDANFQFKSKFRPTTHSAFLCRAPGADPAHGMDFIGALNAPFASVGGLVEVLQAGLSAPSQATVEAGEAVPGLVHRQIDLAIGDPVFESHLAADQPTFLADHEVGGMVVMPATGYMEVAWSVAKRLGRPTTIHQLNLSEVQTFHTEGYRKFQVITEAFEDGHRLHFASRGEEDSESPWTVHGDAILSSEEAGAVETVDLQTLRQRCTDARSAAEVYRRLTSLGLSYGPAFRTLDALWVGDGEALGQIAVPTHLETDGYLFHPALLDACLHVYFPLAGLDSGQQVLLPVRVEGARLLAGGAAWQQARTIYAHLEVLPTATGDSGDEPGFRLRLMSAEGEVWVECAEVRLRRLQLASFRDVQRRRLEGCLSVPTWKPAETRPPAAISEATRWVVASDAPDRAEDLAKALQKHGGTVSTVPLTEVVETVSKASSTTRDLRLVLDVWDAVHSAADPNEGLSTEALLNGALGVALDLVHVLGDSTPAVRLWFLTRGGGGALGGLARVIERELPSLWGGWVDLSEEISDGMIDALTVALAAAPGGPRQRWVEGQPFEEVLIPRPARELGSPELRADGLYLITGGLGGLGLEVAARWVDLGARHLALLGRSAPDDEQTLAVDALRRRGATVDLLRVDVTDGAALEAVLEPLRAQLRGVVHAAGRLDDGLLASQDRERFRNVLTPKVDGAWNLHRLTRGLDLDHFVLFSSIASLVGNPGQGNYAAGNAYMDALAEYRHRLDLPATSIHWGPWASVGMAVDSDSAGQRSRQGVSPLEVGPSLIALEGALTSPDPRWAVFAVEPDAFLAGSLAPLPILAEVTAAARRRSAAVTPSLPSQKLSREALTAQSADEQQSTLVRFLTAEIARAVGTDPASLDPEHSTEALGIDSLVVMELRNRIKADLQIEIPTTFFFEFPSIHDIAVELRERLENPDDGPPIPTETPASEMGVTTADVDAMSGDDVDALLAQLLAEENP